MKNISDIIKQNEEEFDKKFVHNKKDWIPEVHATAKSLSDFLNQSQLRLISAFKEMVEELKKPLIEGEGFKETKQDRRKEPICRGCGEKYICQCGGYNKAIKEYNKQIDVFLSSLIQKTKV